MRTSLLVLAALSFGSVVACDRSKEPASTAEATSSPATPPAANAANDATAAPPSSPAHPAADPAARAEIGKPAPDFALKDLDGKEVRLSSLAGKTVVLEWFNPGCPFVQAAHTKGSLKDAARRHAKDGVVWLAINSNAPGKQGAGVETNRGGAKSLGMSYPVLLDESGTVGKIYGATNTPHMMVIDDKGTLVYRGAIDNSPDGEGESAPDNKLVSYVDAALADLAAHRPVSAGETKAYGCSVKYGR